MSHPSFFAGQYGDEELYRKLGELGSRINAAYQAGNMQMLTQLQLLYETLEIELQERAIAKQEQKSSSIVIETDPDMRKLNEQEQAGGNSGRTKGR